MKTEQGIFQMSKPTVPKISNYFGEAIKEARIKLYLTQADIAKSISSALITVQSAEQGIRTIMDKKVLHLLANVLKIDFDVLTSYIIKDKANDLISYFTKVDEKTVDYTENK